MIEKRAFDGEPLISLEYNLTPDNSTNSKPSHLMALI